MAMRSEARWLVVSLGGLAAAGCAQVDPGMGEAVKYDQAIQTVNPDPVYLPSAARPGDSGTTAAAAAERYRKGTVKPVEKITISSSASSGPK